MSTMHALREYRYPRHVWGWKSVLVVLVPVLAPLVTALALAPDLRSLSAAAAAAGLVFYPVVFVSAVFLYFHWRLTSAPASYWLTVALSLIAAHGVVLSVLQRGDVWFSVRPGWLIAIDLVVGLVLLAMLQAAERVSVTLDPAALGIVLGLVIAGADIAVTRATAGLSPDPMVVIAAKTLLVVLGLGWMYSVHQLRTLPPWAGVRLGLAALTLAVYRTMAHPPTPWGELGDVVVLATGLAGSVLLCSTTLALLRAAIHDDRAVIRHLQELLAVTENEARAGRDRLHEIRSAVAGIGSATALIASQRHQRRIPPTQLQLLHELVERETARLQRLTYDQMTPLEEEVDLDDILRPLAASQRVRGLDVRWSPSGQRVRGSADRIAEVVQTLLDNARHHADGSPVDIEVRRHGPDVEIVVADAGPGVPPELRDAIFDRGTRQGSSSGEGIGLSVARQLMDEVGNGLRLDASRDRGAAFVIRLPAADPQDTEA